MIKEPTPKPTEKPKHTLSNKNNLISLFAVILAVVAIVLALVAWQQKSRLRGTEGNQSTQWQQSVTELKTALERYQQQTQTAIAANQSNISQLMNQSAQGTQEQATAYAGYLIRLAHLHLSVENNLPLGIELLKIAQQRLQPIPTSNVTSLKQALSNDIAALSALPQIDKAGLINQIDTLSDQIAHLPTQPTLAPPAPEPSTATDSSKSYWDKIKHNLSGLKNLFIVRRVDTPMTSLLQPQQSMFLREDVRFKLLQAQWALLHQERTLYGQSLNKAAQLLSQYDQNQPATALIAKQLQALAIIDIKPQIPELQSLRILPPTTPAAPSLPNKPERTESVES